MARAKKIKSLLAGDHAFSENVLLTHISMMAVAQLIGTRASYSLRYSRFVCLGHIGQTFLSPKEGNLAEEIHDSFDEPSYVMVRTSQSLPNPRLQTCTCVSPGSLLCDRCLQSGRHVTSTSLPDKQQLLENKFRRILKQYDQVARQKANWCYDTPGVVNEQQVTSRVISHRFHVHVVHL